MAIDLFSPLVDVGQDLKGSRSSAVAKHAFTSGVSWLGAKLRKLTFYCP
jgi:hypothetical protein